MIQIKPMPAVSDAYKTSLQGLAKTVIAQDAQLQAEKAERKAVQKKPRNKKQSPEARQAARDKLNELARIARASDKGTTYEQWQNSQSERRTKMLAEDALYDAGFSNRREEGAKRYIAWLRERKARVELPPMENKFRYLALEARLVRETQALLTDNLLEIRAEKLYTPDFQRDDKGNFVLDEDGDRVVYYRDATPEETAKIKQQSAQDALSCIESLKRQYDYHHSNVSSPVWEIDGRVYKSFKDWLDDVMNIVNDGSAKGKKPRKQKNTVAGGRRKYTWRLFSKDGQQVSFVRIMRDPETGKETVNHRVVDSAGSRPGIKHLLVASGAYKQHATKEVVNGERVRIALDIEKIVDNASLADSVKQVKQKSEFLPIGNDQFVQHVDGGFYVMCDVTT